MREAGVTPLDAEAGRVSAAPSILETIAAHKRAEVAAARARVSEAEVRRRAAAAPAPRDFTGALRRAGFGVIAEIKRASPSAGRLGDVASPAALARAYADGGAAALSVVTDARFFQGRPEDLQEARAAVDLPVLRKDFVLEPYQVYEARALGADAVLLIAALLEVEALAALRRLAAELGMAALVEVHTAGEARRARAAGADLVGVNNRDLRTFAVDLETTRRLAPQLPPGAVRVAESGIEGPADVARLRPYVDAVLVGSALVRSPDPADLVRRMRLAGGVPVGPDARGPGRGGGDGRLADGGMDA